MKFSAILCTLSLAQLPSVSATANATALWERISNAVDPFFCNTIGKCRRRLGGVEVEYSSENIVDELEWKAYQEKCQEHEYSLKLYVDGHLFVVATPVEDDTNCDSMVFHTISGDDLRNKKQILKLKNDPEVMDYIKSQAIDLDTHTMTKIAHAFDKAEANAPNAETSDIIKNNCGDFVKHFGALLGIKATPSLTKSIAMRLAKNGGDDLFAQLRYSPNLHVVGGQEVEDEELVFRLVESRTSDLYN